MKNVFLMVFMVSLSSSLFAQKMAHDRYTISGGLLGAMNISQFNIDGQNPRGISYDPKSGWAGGVWLNLPLGRCLSLEPQGMYSLHSYKTSSTDALLVDGNLTNISIPLLLKLHLGKSFAFTAGPQIDLLSKLEDGPADVTKDDFTETSLSISGGVEILPHSRFTIFGRYVHGLDNMNNSENVNYPEEYLNTNIQVGLKLKLFGKFIPADSDADGIPDVDDNCPSVAGLERYVGCPIPDTDGDGLNDEVDKCPNEVGIAKYEGCPVPDTDGDGVDDETDKCLTVPGFARYSGCPIPDTDGDSLNDEVDKCPNQPGTLKYGGCPIPDTDGDGVHDEIDKCPSMAGSMASGGCPDRDNDGVIDGEDRCPDVKGLVENGGCPKVQFTTPLIQFATGRSTLTADSKNSIKEGAKLLNSDDFKMLKVEVQGHADTTGTVEFNMKLSQKRAEVVKAELVKNGVSADRITTASFGEAEPIADNKTEEGRAQNRRVVFVVRQ